MVSGSICAHCGREIVWSFGYWVDPNAHGDDAVWREVCDSHDTFTAEHEPSVPGCEWPMCNEEATTDMFCATHADQD